MTRRYIIGTAKHRLRTLLFGDVRHKCMLCGAEVFDNSGLCSRCYSLMPLNNGKTCIRCGCSLETLEQYCINCSHGNKYIDKAYSVYMYEGSVPKVIRSVKFSNRADRIYILAQNIAYKAKQLQLHCDIVCNVPMIMSAQKVRGYNQSQLLSWYFCDIMGMQYCDALVKVHNTIPQEQLSRTERRANLAGAFRADKALVKGKHILLIDDVMTTGATLDSCAKAAKRAGALSVVGLCVASGTIKLTMEDNNGTVH